MSRFISLFKSSFSRSSLFSSTSPRPFPSTPSTSYSALQLSPRRQFSSSPVVELIRKATKLKLKTHKGAAKRWLVVANGAFKRSKTGRVHLNGHMSPTRLNRLGQVAYASPIQKRLLRRLMPYA